MQLVEMQLEAVAGAGKADQPIACLLMVTRLVCALCANYQHVNLYAHV
jgi:hypothetical protein